MTKEEEKKYIEDIMDAWFDAKYPATEDDDIFVDDDYFDRLARKEEGYNTIPNLAELFDIAIRVSQLSDGEREQYDKPFENKRLEGKDAHAYKEEYSNAEIAMLYERGLSLRQIAKELGCKSPSTIRNRLIKMGLINNG